MPFKRDGSRPGALLHAQDTEALSLIQNMATADDVEASNGHISPARRPSAEQNGDFKIHAAFEEVAHAKRGLKQRHIQMIALAGTIGTGLFLATGKALANGGPLGIILAYGIVGLLICAVVLSIAELSALVPLSGGIIRHAEWFVDPALAFAQGWNSVYANAILLPAEMVACAVIIDYWTHINHAVWITVLGGVLVFSNFLLISVYGELEFIFAILKIALIVGVNILVRRSQNPASLSLPFFFKASRLEESSHRSQTGLFTDLSVAPRVSALPRALDPKARSLDFVSGAIQDPLSNILVSRDLGVNLSVSGVCSSARPMPFPTSKTSPWRVPRRKTPDKTSQKPPSACFGESLSFI